MIKTIRAVKGDQYSRLVHTIIMADQVESISNIFVDASSAETKEIATYLAHAQMSMVAQIVKSYVRASQFNEEQVEEAFKDAERVQKNTFDLLDRAKDLSQSGKVIGE